jgi:CheY-like chemotaxis protein
MVRKSKIQHTSNWTILLTDDDLDYAQTTRMLLEREGHRVLLAEDGTTALKTLRDHHVDLLLLDYFMPNCANRMVISRSFCKPDMRANNRRARCSSDSTFRAITTRAKVRTNC